MHMSIQNLSRYILIRVYINLYVVLRYIKKKDVHINRNRFYTHIYKYLFRYIFIHPSATKKNTSTYFPKNQLPSHLKMPTLRDNSPAAQQLEECMKSGKISTETTPKEAVQILPILRPYAYHQIRYRILKINDKLSSDKSTGMSK